MIVCHCQNITTDDIDNAIEWMRASDPRAIITPRKVYQALGSRPDCGGCLPLFLSTMRANPCLPVLRELPIEEMDEEIKANEG